MGKYQPLGDYLRQQNKELVPMRFEEIERVIGAQLPETSQRYPAWWSNNPSNNVMTKVWLDAGYRSEQVDISGRRLVFRRARDPKASEGGLPAASTSPSTAPSLAEPSPPAPKDGEQRGPACRHPLFGALKGLLRIMPGTDLTKPADPDWGEK
jgi:hypothetical protein